MFVRSQWSSNGMNGHHFYTQQNKLSLKPDLNHQQMFPGTREQVLSKPEKNLPVDVGIADCLVEARGCSQFHCRSGTGRAGRSCPGFYKRCVKFQSWRIPAGLPS